MTSSHAASTAAIPELARTRLSGWGANVRAECELVEPETPPDVSRWIDRRGTIARGLGRSYGDPAQNAGGRVVGMTRIDRYLAFDANTGTLRCEAGTSLEQIIRDFAPRGWFPTITPGTKYVTVGGCIANDVHGKAHHAQGSFASCVESMRVLLASGDVVTASRTHHADLFWASFGGMGLLGIVLDVSMRLRAIETTYYRQKAIVVNDLQQMLAAFAEHDASNPYSVAYVDVIETGARIGRGVLTVGDDAKLAELPPTLAQRPLKLHGGQIDVPFELPSFVLNRLSLRVVNALITARQARPAPFSHYEGFLFPLDILGHWNRGYGKRGFTQYQFVLPFADGYRQLRAILDVILRSGNLPSLNVLKRLGPASGGPLSFPFEGYTFAIDFPVRNDIAQLLHRLDAMVAEAGGRIYLGKDSFVTATTFRRMYPQLGDWLRTKAKYDPDNVFTSDLARRVGLVPS